MPLIARHLTISGHVQGVFYRAWTVQTAEAMGLTGWVRNRANGEVEAFVQGDEPVVQHFIERLWNGPPAARVDDIQVTVCPPESLPYFEKRATF